MQLIESADAFLEVLERNSENIFFGAGGTSRSVLRYLKKINRKSRVLCIAVSRMELNPDLLEDVPVIPVHNMGHFAENAAMFIMTKPNQHEEVLGVLRSLGFQNIYALSEDSVTEMDEEIRDYEAVTNSDILQRIEYARIAMEEQNEIMAVNSATFQKYKNCNIGKQVVIVGTGPTLNRYEPKKGAIHIGLNGAWRRKDIPWDYYFAQDFDRRSGEHREFVENVSCPFFIGRYSQNFIGAKYYEAPVSYGVLRDNISPYFLDVFPSREMYLDIAYHALFSYGSIAFPALQFAMYTCPEKIYLVGCDVTPRGHFYQTEQLYDNYVSTWRVGYAKVKTFAEYYYPDTEIISINPVGLKGLFKDIYSD